MKNFNVTFKFSLDEEKENPQRNIFIGNIICII